MSTSQAPAPTVNADRAIKLVMQLMAIPGKSGEEGAVTEFVVKHLRDAGVKRSALRWDRAHKRSPIGGAVGNLILQLPGTSSSPRRLLMAHLDTVPLCVGAKPQRRGPVVRSANPRTALGADDRAGVGVVLQTALEILRRRLPHPPLTFFWPVQEEVGLYGARYADLNLLGRPALCFNWDGGPPAIYSAGATGSFELDIEIAGLASHAGGAPERGVSAVAIAGLAIAELHRTGWHGLVKHKGLRGTSNIGIIQGGDATNVVTDRLTIVAEARAHDRGLRRRIVAAYRTAFERAARQVRSSEGARGRVRFVATHKYESFELPERAACVRKVRRVLSALGVKPQRRISNGGLDANWMTERGLPTVTLGCGMSKVHTVKEALILKEYLQACRVGLALATDWPSA